VSAVPPIRREILVDTDPATAFEVFTDRLGQWWPLAELSVYGADATVEFTDGQIIERSADGQATVWGTVTRWEPPDAVGFSWHPGQPAESASHVEVTFAAAAGQTRVRLEHSGWEAFTDPAVARAEYDHGWPMVLDRYRDYAADTAPGRPRPPPARCSRIHGSPSTSRSSTGCARPGIWSPRVRCPIRWVRA
jgi:hypothetical protein